MLGPSHGYDLHQRLTAELGSIWHVSQSQAYSVLKRLGERGDVAVRRGEKAKLRRRQVLRVTPQGRRRFRQWLLGAAGAGARRVRLEFLTRLYFASRLTPKKVGQIYIAQSREIARTVRRLQMLMDQVPEEQTFNRTSLDLRLRQLQLVRRWMQEIRVKFQIDTEAAR